MNSVQSELRETILKHFIRSGFGGLVLGALTSIPTFAAAEANYDEAKVGNYSLPDCLRMEDGRSVTNAAMWLEQRRPELMQLFQRQVYGRPLPRPSAMRFTVLREDKHAMDGRATRRDVQMEMSAATNGVALKFTLFIPNAAARPVPAFVGVKLFDTAAERPIPAAARRMRASDRASEEANARAGRQAADLIIDRGYAFASLDTDDLCIDAAATYWQGAMRLFGRTQPGSPGPEETGALGVWAWGLSRVLDYLESIPEIDASRVSVIGHSRRGKAALWAGAIDTRFAITFSNNSGCGGAALSKRIFGETVAIITHAFPHWFCGNFTQYADHEERLPVNQHELIALIAPRPVYVASAADDQWADPRGEFLAALNAEPVYLLLNAGGLGVKQMPAADQTVGETIGYHVRYGQHDLTEYDWGQYLAFADRQFGRKTK